MKFLTKAIPFQGRFGRNATFRILERNGQHIVVIFDEDMDMRILSYMDYLDRDWPGATKGILMIGESKGTVNILLSKVNPFSPPQAYEATIMPGDEGWHVRTWDENRPECFFRRMWPDQPMYYRAYDQLELALKLATSIKTTKVVSNV